MKVSLPVYKDQVLDVEIMDLTYQGMGVAKVDNYPIFIDNTLPSEKITVKVTKTTKNFAFGDVVKILQVSPHRVNPKGRVYRQTGIAPLQHLEYSEQLKFKQHQIAELFAKVHMDDVEVLPTIGMDHPSQYRNKAQVPVRKVQGELTTGFYKKNSHQLMPLEDYYIQDPAIDHAIIVIRDILRKYHEEAYDEFHHSGTIRTIMVRRGYYSHEMMVVLVTRTKRLPMADVVVEEIQAALPEVVSVIQNVNQKRTNVILGPVNNVLAGKSTMNDQLLGLTFAISAQSFYQVNPQQTEKLYQLAIDQAGLTGNETVIDAYSGIGTISLTMAQHAKQVYGVDIVPAAIDNARQNADKNGIKNAEFVLGSAEKVMAQWQEDGIKPDVVVVDPPRKGLDEAFIESAAAMGPKRVVYISCNPSTLVRDVQRFAEHGYHINAPVQPVDQFPQTPHIESVTVLERD
ncbi:23S rRNA (uracil(1939)-C(5))-methyltransferase RlmD [Lactiplantibacillus mudanjiangensis]|uniref:23S rRNA (Uracil-5-)-methyltransferase RumA [Lactobacillus pentosus] n=1 Tax=Lactiplantibacillus mudanjiangensis TaxID=1296538 RepID=A0A660E2L0_9LACO|nr:23S rRNA (uracil(1939)-C(5))-methyltransferase RlmD [Lactiplantibacillus mudanjiangensis]VDG17621.1 23S rRNA (uracil-5-)-methyltransferase RumA [Lactobacillus pentosus] [Lactiplantibacillus mudanjiangensis]VDG23106.1 23S rRNA (uracil-5-)-methyltransferase RumA [Lactobacillus pentosus] [Lactiplantibacillus mudanjiangensis]VDG29576.1 23S rRNA (uracil-5-)-methyltransferase RumA [Lactobacillus pentosus] [Lactiplantibacillus mudanjiangensis]VDG32689.1 23S rRNA (uracil-5-)-methyltransferase RumA [